MEIKGTIKVIKATEVVSEKFSKRELVVTTEEQYPQHISIQFTQDKCDLLNKFSIGQSVEVGINLRGREWTSPQGEVKYFNTIEGWRVSSQTETVEQHPQELAPEPMNQEENDDLLPF
jgi:hypothetical protein